MLTGLKVFLIILAICVFWATVSLGQYFKLSFSKTVEYFKTKRGKGVLFGILLATTLTALFMVGVPAIGAEKGEKKEFRYLQWAEVYFGLDYTKKLSPQCEEEGPDSHTTSNLGLKLNLLETYDGRGHINAIYTHHSCAFNADALQYDAIGIQGTYRFWIR